MNNNSLPTNIKLSGKEKPFKKIFITFAKTNYGKTLRSNIRFHEFIPDGMSKEAWLKTLGGDVSNLYHLAVSLENTKYFLSVCSNPHTKWHSRVPKEARFTLEEQRNLLFTSVIHDWAEAIIGDIPVTSKKETDEDQEMVVLRRLMHEILGDGKDSKKIDSLANTVQTILTDKSTKLGQAFNAIERMGYLKTGMRAWYTSKKVDGELKKRLNRLAQRVVTIHSLKLLGYTEVYPAIDAYLIYRKKAISEIFEQTPDRNEEAYEKWIKYIANKTHF